MSCISPCPQGVRFRTEKSLFSGHFAAKFFVNGVANRGRPAGKKTSNKKGTTGHVR